MGRKEGGERREEVEGKGEKEEGWREEGRGREEGEKRKEEGRRRREGEQLAEQPIWLVCTRKNNGAPGWRRPSFGDQMQVVLQGQMDLHPAEKTRAQACPGMMSGLTLYPLCQQRKSPSDTMMPPDLGEGTITNPSPKSTCGGACSLSHLTACILTEDYETRKPLSFSGEQLGDKQSPHPMACATPLQFGLGPCVLVMAVKTV